MLLNQARRAAASSCVRSRIALSHTDFTQQLRANASSTLLSLNQGRRAAASSCVSRGMKLSSGLCSGVKMCS